MTSPAQAKRDIVTSYCELVVALRQFHDSHSKPQRLNCMERVFRTVVYDEATMALKVALCKRVLTQLNGSVNIRYISDKDVHSIQEVGSDMSYEACADINNALAAAQEQNAGYQVDDDDGFSTTLNRYAGRFHRLALVFKKHTDGKSLGASVSSLFQAGMDAQRASRTAHAQE